MLRLFIAIELPLDIRALMQIALQNLRAHGLAVRWVEAEATHLTLKFLGATPPEHVSTISAKLQAVAKLHAPFALRTSGLGMFPQARAPKVIWLGVDGELSALHALRADVEREIAPLGYPTEERPFRPHLTLGRARKEARPAELATIGRIIAGAEAPVPSLWHAHTISLMRSELGANGARYTRLDEISLTGAEPLL